MSEWVSEKKSEGERESYVGVCYTSLDNEGLSVGWCAEKKELSQAAEN